MASQMFESEEGDSDDERIPPADQAVREPEAAAAAAVDGLIPTEWMRNITSSLVSLQTSFSLFTAQQDSNRRNRRRHTNVVSSGASS